MNASGISCFHRVGIRDSQGNRVGYGISIPLLRASETLEFTLPFFLALCFRVTHERLSERGLPPKLTSAKTVSWQRRTYSAYSCVSGNGFIQKIKILSPDFKEREDVQSCHIPGTGKGVECPGCAGGGGEVMFKLQFDC